MTATASIRPALPATPPAAPAAPRLRLVPPPARAGTHLLGWSIVALVLLGAVLLGQLALSIAVSQGAYQLQQMEAQQLALQREATALGEQVDVLDSPQHLAIEATGLGMVPGESFQQLDTASGQILGGGESHAAAIDPALVGNSALQPAAAATDTGVAQQDAQSQHVPSAQELHSPSTR